jgi:hydroxymethylbilane synthase
MQSDLPKDFELIAFTARELPNDVIISHDKTMSLKADTKLLTVGTSSVRRVAMLKHYYPHIQIVDMRGNLQTRIAKMESGICDMLMLAHAGVNRMQYNHLIVQTLPTHQFTPPVGQGSIAVEVSVHLESLKKELLRKYINDRETEDCLKAERAYLKRLQGGCSIPVFALATCSPEQRLTITGGIISLDGKTLLRETLEDKTEYADQLGQSLANLILEKGGDTILESIKRDKSVSPYE